MKTTFRKITATSLAVLTAAFTFCFTSFAAEKPSGADVYIGEHVFQFDEIDKAWQKAAEADTSSKLVLNEDWKADENGSFGTGKYFSDGYMFLFDKRAPMTIDLNGYKIDRGLKEAKNGGRIFDLQLCKSITFTDSSEAKTGTITGGNNLNSGGAFSIYGSKVNFENITVSGNASASKGGAFFIKVHSTEDFDDRAVVTFDNCKLTGNNARTGGAVYLDVKSDLFIFDTEITGNTAINDAGIHTELNWFFKSEITLGGKVIIADNKAEREGTGLMLDECLIDKMVIGFSKERPLSDDSRIVILSKTEDRTLRITKDSDDNNIGCFTYENGKYEIVAKGSGNNQYLDIKKV